MVEFSRNKGNYSRGWLPWQFEWKMNRHVFQCPTGGVKYKVKINGVIYTEYNEST